MNDHESSASGDNARLDCAIVAFYFLPAQGGIQYYLQRLSTALERRISVVVLAPNLPGADETDRSLPFGVIRHPMGAAIIERHEYLFKPLYPFVGLAVFYWTLASFWRRKPRMICSGTADFAWAVAAAARLMGSDFSFICYGEDTQINKGLFPLLAKRVPLLFAIRMARVCFTISKFTWGLLDPDGKYSSKVRLLRVPIDKVDAPSPSDEEIGRARVLIRNESKRLGAEPRGDIILSVGRLREKKGFHHAIEAFGLIAKEFPDCVYVLVGGGPFENELRRTAERVGVADRVVFIGTVPSPDPFYALAKVFVTVTWDMAEEPEGFGMVFLEAGCFGVPSIAGNTGGMPEAVLDGKTGFCVQGASPRAIAEALRRLLGEDSLRGELGVHAREYAKQFAPDLIAEEFIRGCGLESFVRKAAAPATDN